jgi:hypothetical protein
MERKNIRQPGWHRSGERGRPARCLWPPAKDIRQRHAANKEVGRSKRRASRRDANWKRPGRSRSPTFAGLAWRHFVS